MTEIIKPTKKPSKRSINKIMDFLQKIPLHRIPQKDGQLDIEKYNEMPEVKGAVQMLRNSRAWVILPQLWCSGSARKR